MFSRAFLFASAAAMAVMGLQAQAEPSIIPRPTTLALQNGCLVLRAGDAVALPEGTPESCFRSIAEAASLPLVPSRSPDKARVRFLSAADLPRGTTPPQGEGYLLRVTPEALSVYAATPAGQFYGLQTAAQLLRGAARDHAAVTIPCMDISDAPRFGWRGYMLDESRHFSGKAAVCRLLDAMAYYKLNRLHWHLTDSPAWRLEIKAYPKLTQIGARGSESDRRAEAPALFYTQSEIKEIVAFARERHITVIPEIDMPGHADAAVAAYPELDGGGFLQKNQTEKWPRFTFNPAKPETLRFLDQVLAETAALFPDSGVIHFGGDEVHFG